MFSVATIDLFNSFKEQFPDDIFMNIFYLDDGMIVCELDKVQDIMDFIVSESAKIGLKVNVSKCSVFSPHHEKLDFSHLQDIQIIRDEGIKILGSPVGSREYISTFVLDHIRKQKRLIELIQQLDDLHLIFPLMKHCSSLNKVNHLLRTCPFAYIQDALQEYDDYFNDVFDRFASVPLTPQQRELFYLPTIHNGLGFQKASDVAPIAYYSAAIDSYDLCKKLDPNYYMDDMVHSELLSFQSTWQNDTLIESLSLNTVPFKYGTQHHITQRMNSKKFEKFNCWISSTDVYTKATQQNVQDANLGKLFVPNPCVHRGTYLDSVQFSILIRRLLAHRVIIQQEIRICPTCFTNDNDLNGIHALNCKNGETQTHSRHTEITRFVAQFIRSCGFTVTLEKNGGYGTRERPGDIHVPIGINN